MFQEAKEVTHSNGIDSIVKINAKIDNYEKENFRIYITDYDNKKSDDMSDVCFRTK